MNYISFFKLIGIAAITLYATSTYSQDLIVTNEGDSLNCKITKIKTDYIYFTFKHKDEIRSTLLPIEQIKKHQYNFFQASDVPAHAIVSNEIYPHFRVSINGGWSNRLGRISEDIPSDFKEYMKDLKSGYHFGFDLSYYVSEQLGVGFKYSNYLSNNSINIVNVTLPDGSNLFGKMSDDISIKFIGSFFSSRFLDAEKKNSFIFSLGIGYLNYWDNAVLISDFTIKGNTVGLCWDIGYDIGLSENFAIGFQLSYVIGTLTQYDISDGITTETIKLEKENYESLSRIDLSIGLRFNK